MTPHRPTREETDRGIQTARAILAVRRGPRGAAASLVAVACEHCGAPSWEPCVVLATGRPMTAVHPSRAAAADRRDDHLDADVPWPLPTEPDPDDDCDERYP